MFDVVGIGEALVQLNPIEDGPLRHAYLFEKHMAGSESNVLIGLSRLGFRTAFISKLGKDEFSKFILGTLASEHVDVSHVKLIDNKSCGVYFIQRNFPLPGKNDVLYFRSDSAAKLLSAEDVGEEFLRKCKVLQLSGITPALGEAPREACLKALEIASKYGIPVSFDTNYRKKLWSTEEAEPILSKIVSKSRILFTDQEDAAIILGERCVSIKETFDRLSELGPKTIVLKLGATGGLAARSIEGQFESRPINVPVVDHIGAGDAVVAGFLAGILSNQSTQTSLDMATYCAALAVMRRGDFESLPDRQQVNSWITKKDLGPENDPR